MHHTYNFSFWEWGFFCYCWFLKLIKALSIDILEHSAILHIGGKPPFYLGFDFSFWDFQSHILSKINASTYMRFYTRLLDMQTTNIKENISTLWWQLPVSPVKTVLSRGGRPDYWWRTPWDDYMCAWRGVSVYQWHTAPSLSSSSLCMLSLCPAGIPEGYGQKEASELFHPLSGEKWKPCYWMI